MESPDDDILVWSLVGKQVTLGVVEQDKSVKDRIVRRRSFTTKPGAWENPSVNGVYGSGWNNFLTHDLFFYPKWNYISNDTVLFSFR